MALRPRRQDLCAAQRMRFSTTGSSAVRSVMHARQHFAGITTERGAIHGVRPALGALPRPLSRCASIILHRRAASLHIFRLTLLSNVVAYPCRHSLERIDTWSLRDNRRAHHHEQGALPACRRPERGGSASAGMTGPPPARACAMPPSKVPTSESLAETAETPADRGRAGAGKANQMLALLDFAEESLCRAAAEGSNIPGTSGNCGNPSSRPWSAPIPAIRKHGVAS